MVVIVDENIPRNNWPKGTIEEHFFGSNHQVRRAVVRTDSGTYIRPASKLAVLQVADAVDEAIVDNRLTRGECWQRKVDKFRKKYLSK